MTIRGDPVARKIYAGEDGGKFKIDYLRTPLGVTKCSPKHGEGEQWPPQEGGYVVLRPCASNGALGFALALTVPELEWVPGTYFLWEGRKIIYDNLLSLKGRYS